MTDRVWVRVSFLMAPLFLLPAAGSAASIDCSNLQASAGAVPPELITVCGGQRSETPPRLDPSDVAVGPDGVLTQCSSMTLNDPGNPATVGYLDFRPACDIVGDDFLRLYCYTFDVPGVLSWVNPVNCTEIVIGTGSNSQNASGMSWDATTGTMYLSTTDLTSSELHTVDLGTGATTPVGSMGPDSPGNIAIGMTGGQMYGFDVVNDSLQSIDKTTGLATTIGPLGFDANFAQGLDFDESDGTCYLFAFDNVAFAGELRTCDISTGATTLVGTIGNGVDLRQWTGAGILAAAPSPAPYCLTFDNFCDSIQIENILPDKTVVATWDNSPCGLPDAPLLGGYSGKNVSPRLSWLAGDPNANLDVFSFNLNVDTKTFDLFLHDSAFNLIQFQDDETYTVVPGACPFAPDKVGSPPSTGLRP